MKNIVRTKDYVWKTFDNVIVEYGNGYMAYIPNRGWYGPFNHRSECEDFLTKDLTDFPSENLYTRIVSSQFYTLGDLREFLKSVEDLDDGTKLESTYTKFFTGCFNVEDDRIYIDVEP